MKSPPGDAPLLDAIDRRILSELQADGRMTNVELARRAGISAPPCLRRVRRLEDAGVIRGYHADPDPQKLGWQITFFAVVGLDSQKEAALAAFEQLVAGWPEVRECHMIRGGGDFLLKLVARDTSHENQLTQRLTGAPTVTRVQTLQTIRTSRYLTGGIALIAGHGMITRDMSETAPRIPQIAAPAGGAPVLTVVVPCYNERANVAPLIAKLDATLQGIAWEVVYVDDNSPDGTAAEVRRIAQSDPRVHCIRRIGRRGLASAVIEGALSSSAQYVAVIDGDLQHDETRLPEMLTALQSGKYDLAVGSRHVAGGDAAGLANRWRHALSDGGIRLAQFFLPMRLTDPMSGFFMLPRPLFETLAATLTGQGFKILLDLALSSPAPLRVIEVPYVFQERVAGESKLDALVLIQFAGLLLDKVFGGLLPLRFISFALVGALGVVVHLAVLTTALKLGGLPFEPAQAIATVIAMVFNFQLNNEITYRDQRLRGPRLWRGLLLFIVVCGFGAIANIGIANTLYETHTNWSIAGAIGALIGVVWNYAVSATLVWRAR